MLRKTQAFHCKSQLARCAHSSLGADPGPAPTLNKTAHSQTLRMESGWRTRPTFFTTTWYECEDSLCPFFKKMIALTVDIGSFVTCVKAQRTRSLFCIYCERGRAWIPGAKWASHQYSADTAFRRKGSHSCSWMSLAARGGGGVL